MPEASYILQVPKEALVQDVTWEGFETISPRYDEPKMRTASQTLLSRFAMRARVKSDEQTC